MSSRTRRQDIRRSKGHSPTQPKPYSKAASTLKKPKKQSPEDRYDSPFVPSLFPGESEPAPGSLGMPSRVQYKHIEGEYLTSLHPRKQEKALLSQALFDKIWDVLHDPGAARIGTPQFRWWVRKMFVLSPAQGDAADTPDDYGGLDRDAEKAQSVVLHENRPVAIKDQIYDVLCYCHALANHGGRDKTTAVIREHYSWIPKELIAQFVKACPTCVFKKTGNVDLAMSMNTEEDASDEKMETDSQQVVISQAAGGFTERDVTPVNHHAPLPVLDFHGSIRSSGSGSGSGAGAGAGFGSQQKPWMPEGGPASQSFSSAIHPMPELLWPDSSSYDTRSSSCWSSSSYSTMGSEAVHSHVDSNKTLVAPPMQRFGADQRITLPPLMKTLSEGTLGNDEPFMRPLLNVPDGFRPPHPSSSSEGWYAPRTHYPEAQTPNNSLEGYYLPQIDPSLLIEPSQSHWQQRALDTCAVYAREHVPVASLESDEAEASSSSLLHKAAGDSFLLPLTSALRFEPAPDPRQGRRSLDYLLDALEDANGEDPARMSLSYPMDITPFVSPVSSSEKVTALAY